jgi:hypothetical protein
MVATTLSGKGSTKPEGYLIELLGYRHASYGMTPRHVTCVVYMRGYKKGLTVKPPPVKL